MSAPSWPPWLENLSDRDRIRAIVDAVARCYGSHMSAEDEEAPGQHCTAGVAVMLLEQLLAPPAGADPAAIAFAVLYTITEDGEVDHTAIPVFVAEPILAAERARRDAAQTTASGAPDGSGTANSPAPVSGDTGTGSGRSDATEGTP